MLITNERHQNDVLATALPGFHDVWPFLHQQSGHKGYTFDATANPLIDRPRPDERMRYDRVMARMASRSRRRPVGIELVGNEPMETGLFLSDHFGLLTTFAEDKR